LLVAGGWWVLIVDWGCGVVAAWWWFPRFQAGGRALLFLLPSEQKMADLLKQKVPIQEIKVRAAHLPADIVRHVELMLVLLVCCVLCAVLCVRASVVGVMWLVVGR
jgi:hypothetical protein